MNARSFPTTAVAILLLSGAAFGADWTRFRGPNGQGISTDANVPVTWSATENLKWKVKLPGPGTSSPILVGDKVFLTSYSGYGVGREGGSVADLKRHLVCVNRADGKIAWTKDVPHKGTEDAYRGFIGEHGYASHTPVSDGERVYAFFGKSGVVAFDLKGTKLWQTGVGTQSGRMRWGSAASPVLHNNVVIVNASEESAALIGLDKKTGKELWKAQADGLESTWGTPVLVKTKDRTELVIAVPYEVWGLNPDNGKLLWYATAVNSNSMCSSLLVKGDVVYAVGGRAGAAAVRCGGKGDVTKTHVLWNVGVSARINTPVLHNDRLYWISNGVAQCISAKDGKNIYRARVGGGSGTDGGRRGGRGGGGQNYCSPILVNGHIIQMNRKGTAHVYKAGEKFELIATNSLSDGSDFHATPAVGDGQLYIRSNEFLYCIGKTEKK